jgi:2-polyprenyl-6-methoxyphenol hydroxylase-like FAD-dependent oxidoreductase
MDEQCIRRDGSGGHEVVVVGGGPTGLTLAAELALQGVDVAIVEKREDQSVEGSRAGGLHSRTLELLDMRGVVSRFLALGRRMQVGTFGGIPLDISDFPTPHPYGLALRQEPIERALADWTYELGVPVYRAREVTGFEERPDGVDVETSGGRVLRTLYLVGCDGGRSAVRKGAGIDFVGWDPSLSYLVAEAETRDEPPYGMRRDDRGVHGIGKLEDGRVRFVSVERELRQGASPSLDELRGALHEVYGTDFGVHSVSWLSRFTDMARQAVSYRNGRVLLAGDAAHVHSPVGGQGLNLGVQDAFNLGWKLAQVVRGLSHERLLDSYTTERHPIGARVLELTLAQTALARGDARTEALRTITADLLSMDGPRKAYAATMSSLDVHYAFDSGSLEGAPHPMLGRRVPDLELSTATGKISLFRLLREAKHVLLVLGGELTRDLGPWSESLVRVDAHVLPKSSWALPVIGAVRAVEALLVRPDGHVAWVGEGTTSGLEHALRAWVGDLTGG